MQELVDHRTPSDVTAPIVVSLGAQSRKRIRQLRRGKGRLMEDVADVVDQVRSSFGDQAAGKVFVPVVLIYRRKERRGLELWPWGLRL